jgi:Tol biopolymer transport system component
MRPQWTADGSRLTFVSTGTDRQALWVRSADGGEDPQLLYGGERNISEGFLSPDGSWIVIRTNIQDPGGGDILGLLRGVDSVPRALVATEFEEVEPSLSPDGRWLAYVSNEAGPKEVFVRPFPDAASAKWQVSAGGGLEPVWAPSGSELFYRNGAGHLVMVQLQTTPRFVLGRQRVLFSTTAFKSSDTHAQYAVIPGGRGFFMIRTRAGTDRSELVVVENWLATLGHKGGK